MLDRTFLGVLINVENIFRSLDETLSSRKFLLRRSLIVESKQKLKDFIADDKG